MASVGKAFWKSKTFWANAASLGLYTAKNHFGFDVPAPNAEVIAVANIILRLVTKQPITL